MTVVLMAGGETWNGMGRKEPLDSYWDGIGKSEWLGNWTGPDELALAVKKAKRLRKYKWWAVFSGIEQNRHTYVGEPIQVDRCF